MKKSYIIILILCFPFFLFSKDLTLEEAIKIALERNLQIQIEKINVNSFENNIKASKGIFDPLLGADFQISSSKTPSAWQLQGADIYESKRRSFTLSLSQYLLTGEVYQLTGQIQGQKQIQDFIQLIQVIILALP